MALSDTFSNNGEKLKFVNFMERCCTHPSAISFLWIHSRVGHAYAEYANDADYAHTRNMRMKISSTLSTCKYLPKMATFWAKNGSAWLCFHFWLPKISLLFIPLGFIHPQEWKIRVQNHNILVKKSWFFILSDAVYANYAHLMHISKYRCTAIPKTYWNLVTFMPIDTLIWIEG